MVELRSKHLRFSSASQSKNKHGVEKRTARYILFLFLVNIHSISVRIFYLFLFCEPLPLPLLSFSLTFLAEDCLEVFGPPINVLGIIRVLEGSWSVQIGELFP
jgi:hypothetical protein